MNNVIEVKDAITDAISAFPAVFSSLSDLETTMTSAEEALAQNLWTGESKEKCEQIQGLLGEYYISVRELITQLQQEVGVLERNKTSFPSDSNALVIINSI